MKHSSPAPARVSAGSSPDVTTRRGPRTKTAGLTGTTWPVRSAIEQVTERGEPLLDAQRPELAPTGWTAAIDGTPARAHQARTTR